MKRTRLKRRTPLKRTGISRSKAGRSRSRVRPVNRERKAKMYDRNFGEEADRVRAMPCLAFYAMARDGAIGGLSDVTCRGDVVPAHVTARGMGGSKGGRFDIVPLCDAHHREAGEAKTSQRAAFEARYRLDLRAEADRIALEHEPPMGIRALAARWAARCPYCRNHPGRDIRDGICTSCPDCNGSARVTPGSPAHADGVAAGLIKPLDTYETEAIMWWVQREMEREFGRLMASRGRGPRGFMAAIVHHIAVCLGGVFADDGEHGLTWSLCEAAGWPT